MHRIRKLSRKKQALNDGFFTEPSKPYRTMGTVYLNNGEMILSALTDDFRAKVRLGYFVIRRFVIITLHFYIALN